MNKIDQLRAQFAAIGIAKLAIQHEFDTEPTFLVDADNRDDDLIEVTPGNLPLAAALLMAFNNMDTILEVITLAKVALDVYLANGQSEEPSAMNSMVDLGQALGRLK